MLAILKRVNKKTLLRNLSDTSQSNKKYNLEDKELNIKFDHEYLNRLESIEDSIRNGIFLMAFSIGFSGYLINDAITKSTYRSINLRHFYGFKDSQESLDKFEKN